MQHLVVLNIYFCNYWINERKNTTRLFGLTWDCRSSNGPAVPAQRFCRTNCVRHLDHYCNCPVCQISVTVVNIGDSRVFVTTATTAHRPLAVDRPPELGAAGAGRERRGARPDRLRRLRQHRRATEPAARQPILFTSREFDAKTGLYYNRARYLDPTTGRWTTQDPLGFAAGDAKLYRYLNNSPTLATDPSGLIWYPGKYLYQMYSEYRRGQELDRQINQNRATQNLPPLPPPPHWTRVAITEFGDGLRIGVQANCSFRNFLYLNG